MELDIIKTGLCLTRTRLIKILLLGSTLFLGGGCATNKDQYYWGNYEQIIYDTYVSTDGSDPLAQIDSLTTDIEKAENNEKLVPPGVYAHLGMIQASVGNIEDAINALNTEKTLYPESTVLIDGMLSRASEKGSN